MFEVNEVQHFHNLMLEDGEELLLGPIPFKYLLNQRRSFTLENNFKFINETLYNFTRHELT